MLIDPNSYNTQVSYNQITGGTLRSTICTNPTLNNAVSGIELGGNSITDININNNTIANNSGWGVAINNYSGSGASGMARVKINNNYFSANAQSDFLYHPTFVPTITSNCDYRDTSCLIPKPSGNFSGTLPTCLPIAGLCSITINWTTIHSQTAAITVGVTHAGPF